MILSRLALAAALTATLICGCSHRSPERVHSDATVPVTTTPSFAATPTPTPTPTPVPKPKALDRKTLSKALDHYLDGRASGAGIKVFDRTTGTSYEFRAGGEFVTASAVKVDILMTMLLQHQKEHRKLSANERYDAGIMIRESDNFAADRNFVRAGSASGVNRANRSFGLKHTEAIDAKCLDLLCWSLTSTTPRDQIELLKHLFSGPLTQDNRDYVLDLMSKTVSDQRWGIAGGVLKGDKAYNKNGWMTHQRDGDRWAINSIGRIEGHGHDLLIAVMTSHNPSMGYGISTAEHMVKLTADAFRATTPQT